MKYFGLYILLAVVLMLLNGTRAQQTQEFETSTEQQPLNFWASLADTFAIIFIAEIADKTFIMVIIFSMSMNKCLVYAGSATTMVLMHTIATFLGMIGFTLGGVFPLVFNHQVIKWSAVAIFTLFGIYLIVKGCRKKKKRDASKKMEKVRNQLIQQGHIKDSEPIAAKSAPTNSQGVVLNNIPTGEPLVDNRPPNLSNFNTTVPKFHEQEEKGQNFAKLDKEEENVLIQDQELESARPKRNCCKRCFDNAFFKMALVCFVAEIGDRSQITAIALAAANNIWGVWLGGSVAHLICTSLGVGCGALLVGRISPRVLTIISGIVCLAFALEYVIFE